MSTNRTTRTKRVNVFTTFCHISGICYLNQSNTKIVCLIFATFQIRYLSKISQRNLIKRPYCETIVFSRKRRATTMSATDEGDSLKPHEKLLRMHVFDVSKFAGPDHCSHLGNRFWFGILTI